jgi:hypothetical protein
VTATLPTGFVAQSAAGEFHHDNTVGLAKNFPALSLA